MGEDNGACRRITLSTLGSVLSGGVKKERGGVKPV